MAPQKLDGLFHDSIVVTQKSMKQIIPAGAVSQIGRTPVNPMKLIQFAMYTSYAYSFFYIASSFLFMTGREEAP